MKVGGALLTHVNLLDQVLHVIATAGREVNVLVVPGGGPFADAVRDADDQLGLPAETAHWMAVLAMDQYALVLVSRLGAAALVTSVDECEAAWRARRVPVLAPYRWLRESDPLPHSWDVTSDSIAAWIAGIVGARRLVIVKPPGATGAALVDPFFASALPAAVRAEVVLADRIDTLGLTLRPST